MAAKISHLTSHAGGDAEVRQPGGNGPALETTLSPTPLHTLLAADGAAVYVLSSDSGLVDAVTTAAGEQFPIQRLPTLKALRSLVDSGQCRIALLDAEFFGSSVRARITELKAVEPELVVVVAAPRETAEELMGLFAERIIHRLLIKPPAIGITRLFLESAVSRFLQIRAAHEATLAEPLPQLRRMQAPRRGSRAAWFVAIAVATVLIAGVLIGGYMQSRSGDVGSPSTPAERFPIPVEPSQAAVDPSIGSASPTDGPAEATPFALTADSAQAAQAEAPAQSGATTGPLPIVEIGDDVAAGVPVVADDDAAPAASDAVQPGAGTALPAASVSAVIAANARSEPSELDSLLTIARARLERGRLLEPAGDSARDYVTRALSLDAENEGAIELRAEVAAGVVDSARAQLESGNVDRATALAAEARRLNATSQMLARLEADLQAARGAATERAREQLLAMGRARMQEGRLVAPEGDSALFYLESLYAENPSYPGLAEARADLAGILTRRADQAIADKNWTTAEGLITALATVAEPTAVDAVRADLAAGRVQEVYLAVPARPGEMRLLSAGQVAYPEDAQRRDIEGWAATEFIVGVDGVPRAARVVDTQPAGYFEEAALAAVAGHRFAPFERDGRIYERLVQLTIRFNLE
jgi:protein TonB